MIEFSQDRKHNEIKTWSQSKKTDQIPQKWWIKDIFTKDGQRAREKYAAKGDSCLNFNVLFLHLLI